MLQAVRDSPRRVLFLKYPIPLDPLGFPYVHIFATDDQYDQRIIAPGLQRIISTGADLAALFRPHGCEASHPRPS